MIEGLIALICGMGIVFVVLIVISLIISLLKHTNKPKKETVKPVEEIPANVTIHEEEEDDMELVAVITAAIAASLNTTTDKLHVRSFRRVANTHSRWNMNGRSDSARSLY